MSDEKTTPELESEVPAETVEKVVATKKLYKPGVPFIKAVKKGGVKLEFTASPTGKFGLAYNVGEQAAFEKKQAAILIEAGVAKKA